MSFRTNSANFNTVLAILALFVFIFRIHLSSSVADLSEIFIGIELNLENNLEEIDIFMMLNLTISEESLSLHYCDLLSCF